jgi:hypothetical protein
MQSIECSMNVIVEVARAPQHDHPDQQHETDRYRGQHFILLAETSYILIGVILHTLMIPCHPD